MPDTPTAEALSSCLGDRFRVRLGDLDPVDLQLVEIREPESDPQSEQAFSLVFRGPREPVLAHMICTLEHATLGRMDLFLTPIGPDREGGGLLYEAVFS